MLYTPMPLGRRAEPFDHRDWLFELKYDGFRSLAYFSDGQCRLVSRNGNIFKSFSPLAESLAHVIRTTDTVLDGEIVRIDADGKPQFYDLLFRRGTPLFFAFDVLRFRGEDLKQIPLHERKAHLRGILRGCDQSVLCVSHVEKQGVALFERACEIDLEGIVAKYKYGHYTSERGQSTWFKIRNRSYSQWAGREKLFERERHTEPAPGWHSCDFACADAESLERSLTF